MARLAMLLVTLSIVLLSALGLWSAHRWLRRRPPTPDHPHEPVPPVGRAAARVIAQGGAEQVPAAIDMDKVAAARALLTERLWRLAFAAPACIAALTPDDIEVRDRVSAVLGADRLDAKLFPRRPTLMPQLMRAMDDPHAAPERLSRIVAHDPVLAADVLRLANSSRFRISEEPIETLQRAIVVMGVDALRGLLAMAMMQPVFRASRSNFPRFPRMLWERTERAARAADGYAAQVSPSDRFEAQLTILLSALGPLVVYGALLDVYAESPGLTPNPALCAALTCELGAKTALRIAHHWETSARLAAAIEQSAGEPLARALCVGELLGTLSLLQSQHVIGPEEAAGFVHGADLSGELLEPSSPRAA
jgi:HD-like signal output (HDOD) protein